MALGGTRANEITPAAHPRQARRRCRSLQVLDFKLEDGAEPSEVSILEREAVPEGGGGVVAICLFRMQENPAILVTLCMFCSCYRALLRGLLLLLVLLLLLLLVEVYFWCCWCLLRNGWYWYLLDFS